MTTLHKTLALTLALAAAGGAAAQVSTPIDLQYLQTSGITVTTSETTMGYLTGALQLSSSTAGSFEAFCVEVAQGHASVVAGPQTYTLGSFTLAQSQLLQGLYSSSYATLSSNQDKAAFQTAIWEIMEELPGTTLNVSADHFKYLYLSETSQEADDLAFGNQVSAYLLAASAYQGNAQYQLSKLVNGSYQDFIVATPVPEPEGYAMLLAGLATIGFVARRRKAN